MRALSIALLIFSAAAADAAWVCKEDARFQCGDHAEVTTCKEITHGETIFRVDDAAVRVCHASDRDCSSWQISTRRRGIGSGATYALIGPTTQVVGGSIGAVAVMTIDDGRLPRFVFGSGFASSVRLSVGACIAGR